MSHPYGQRRQSEDLLLQLGVFCAAPPSRAQAGISISRDAPRVGAPVTHRPLALVTLRARVDDARRPDAPRGTTAGVHVVVSALGTEAADEAERRAAGGVLRRHVRDACAPRGRGGLLARGGVVVKALPPEGGHDAEGASAHPEIAVATMTAAVTSATAARCVRVVLGIPTLRPTSD